VPTRGTEISKELHSYIRDLWVYKSMSCRAIANHINEDASLKSRFGKIDSSGVFYHIKQIRDEFEGTVSEDSLDTYVSEFIRLKESMDDDIEALDELKKSEEESANPSKELILKIMRERHQVKLNKMKLLQDVELPIRVKQLKRERDRKVKILRPQPVSDKEIVDNHTVE